MMGLLGLPRSLVHTYLRLVGLGLLIVYSLCLRLWESVKPALTPVINIYHAIDPEDVHLPAIVQQFVKLVLMVGVVYKKAALAIWDTVSRPFRKQVDEVVKFLDDVSKEYKERKQIN